MYLLSPTLFQIFVNDTLRVVEAGEQKVRAGGRKVSGCLPLRRGLQKQIDAVIEFASK